MGMDWAALADPGTALGSLVLVASLVSVVYLVHKLQQERRRRIEAERALNAYREQAMQAFHATLQEPILPDERKAKIDRDPVGYYSEGEER